MWESGGVDEEVGGGGGVEGTLKGERGWWGGGQGGVRPFSVNNGLLSSYEMIKQCR